MFTDIYWTSLELFDINRLITRLTLFYNAHTGKIISHCAIFWIDPTPGPEVPKIITNTFLQKNTAFGQSFFLKTLKDWNKLDNETKESFTTLEYKNRPWTSHR